MTSYSSESPLRVVVSFLTTGLRLNEDDSEMRSGESQMGMISRSFTFIACLKRYAAVGTTQLKSETAARC